ncbi:type II secretion system GspH family protein [Patescibacteria group bacterium]|nr:type II secretion system GspH family protein [Patescibacteria group bacterium]
MQKKQSGFTLIEMLVVIAMIGLLSAVLLVALGPSRKKAQDSRIISDLNQIRSLMESTYNPSNSTYGSPDISNLVTDVSNNGGSVNSATTTNTYRFYSALASNSYYCVDSTGFSGVVASSSGISTSTCQ